MKPILRLLLPTFMALTNLYLLHGQSEDSCQKPSMALYDANTASAVTSNTNEEEAINSISKLILQAILSDSSSNQVFLFSYGFADTLGNDLSLPEHSFPLPDSGGVTDANYVIASKIVGSPGNYTLTVTIEDGHTYAHIVEGTAIFGSATTDNVKTACLSAIQQILPLTSMIGSYQESLKTVNPLLAINPKIDISPAKLKLPLKGSTDVTITAIDCDGSPIANRQLNLESTGGTFGSQTVQTDASGKTKVVFKAGSSDGIAILLATIPNLISVTHDTIYSSGSASIVVGNVDTTNLWVLEFDLRRSGTGYKDLLTQVIDGTAWEQKTSFMTQSAHGKILGTANKRKTEFEFIDTTMSVSGQLFLHTFSKYTGPNPSGENCPKKYWEMSGSSQTYCPNLDSEAKSSFSFEYDPQGLDVFSLMIPCTSVDAYGYRWYESGTWESGGCRTYDVRDAGKSKFKLFMSAGISLYGMSPVPGLTIIPHNAGGTITGYTIHVDVTKTGYYADSELYKYTDQCTATLKPFSTVTKDK